jgi:DNA-binding transcriptional LysR family regulator
MAQDLRPIPTFLGEEPVRLALPLAWADAPDPLDLSTLAGEGWIVGSLQVDDHELAQRACALAGFAPRLTHGINDYELQLEMIAAGLGVGLVPALGLRLSAAAKVAIRTPAGPPIRRQIEAVTRGALANSPRVRALLAELPRVAGDVT